MFRGTTNPYDEIVVKATDENQTAENWEIILNLCDKVADEGEAGARNVIAAVLKRLAHRNANVQLYSLAVVEALSKNCGIEVHREIASRAFTQGLEKLITDRTGHDKVKKKATAMIQLWVKEWDDNPDLGIMKECYESLKQKGIKFEQPMEAPPPTVDDDIRRREEEELQRVLELSVQDRGGRSWGGGYVPSAGASSSRDNLPAPSSTAASSITKVAQPAPSGYSASASASKKAVDVVHDTPISANSYSVADSASGRSTAVEQPSYQTPAALPTSPAAPPMSTPAYQPQQPQPQPQPQQHPPAASGAAPASVPDLATATRVRALHNFEPADSGELAFERGDVIKVVDRTHKDWWKGQIKGRTGIFPVNYVEAMPEPTVADLAKEAEQEAAVFAQAANIDRLLTMLRGFDINKDNLADDDEIQELYRSSLGVRPKIIRLIEKYNQKKVELAMMNENFVSAKELFDRMMEESVARHTSAGYDWRRQGGRPPNGPPGQFWPGQYPQGPGGFYPPQQGFHDPNQAAAAAAAAGQYPPQIYPQMDPAAYAAQQQLQQQQQQQQQPQQYPAQDPNAYQQHAQQQPGYDPNAYAAQMQQQQQVQQQQGYDPNVYAQQQQQQGAQPGQQQQQQPAGQPTYDPNAYAAQQQQQQQQPQPGQPQQQPAYDPNAYTQQQQGQQQQQQPVHQGQPGYDPNAYGAQSQQHVPAQDPSVQQQQQQQQPATAGQQPQPEAASPGGEYTQGPPYVYDPNGRYPDPNAQAWAQYYAAGGTDQAGAVYFHSVPGVKEPTSASPPIAQVTQPTPTDTPIDQQPQQQPVYQQQQPIEHQQHVHQQPVQQPHQSPPGQQQQLSPKSPLDQLKQSPRSKRISMAGVGTIAQHPELQSSLPTYAHELHGHRPGSAGGQSTGISPAVAAATPVHQQQPWGHQHQLSQGGVGRATSPASAAGGAPGPMGPWTYGHPQVNEPARTGSTSPPGAATYNRSNPSLAAYGGMQVGAASPGGTFHPASAGPDIHSNQPTPYPAFKPTPH